MNLAATELLAHGGRDGGGFFIFPFLMFILLTLLIVGFIRRRKGWGGPGHPMSPGGGGRGPDAKAVLDERFAKGQIDHAEYVHRKAVLDGDAHIPPAPASSTGSSAATATAVADPLSADQAVPDDQDGGSEGDPNDDENRDS